MSNVSKPQKNFLLVLFSTIKMLRGRMNFRNLSRYSNMHEKKFFKKLQEIIRFRHV